MRTGQLLTAHDRIDSFLGGSIDGLGEPLSDVDSGGGAGEETPAEGDETDEDVPSVI